MISYVLEYALDAAPIRHVGYDSRLLPVDQDQGQEDLRGELRAVSWLRENWFQGGGDRDLGG